MNKIKLSIPENGIISSLSSIGKLDRILAKIGFKRSIGEICIGQKRVPLFLRYCDLHGYYANYPLGWKSEIPCPTCEKMRMVLRQEN